MGEYATYFGESIKIGTCEEMYYLRADQAWLVTAEPGSVDPIAHAAEIRFRFPFPHEDTVAPGQFDDHDHGMRIDGLTAPAELADEHSHVQFVAQHHGYNVCLPCPESGKALEGLTIHRNGFRGATFLVQQVLHEGALVPVLACTCGMKWRLRTMEDCLPLLEALEAMARAEIHRENLSARHHGHEELADDHQTTTREVFDRIRRGFDPEYVAGLGFESVTA